MQTSILRITVRWAITALLLVASTARAETVSYSASLHTSKGNPIYDILILEADTTGVVHADLYPSALPGRGFATIAHDVPYTPAQTLIIGLTEGTDADGSDKTQIVMFLDRDFAAAHAGIPFSSIFQGARHSETIAHLQAAFGGDASERLWFAGTFYGGPAKGAAFDSAGPFAVAEFTSLTIIGANAAAGSWMLNSSDEIPYDDPDALSGRATEVLDETAKGNTGPFDISFTLGDRGQFAVDKTVLNATGVAWRHFEMRLGTGSGAMFVPSTTGDGLSFVAALNNHEETGAFPDVVVEEDRIVFTGFLAPGDTAHFIVFVNTDVDSEHMVTLRQIAGGARVAAPLLTPLVQVLLVALLFAIGCFRMLRRVELGIAFADSDIAKEK